jgi:Zn-dependent peptidase ImmA (M78 family)
LKVDFIPDHVLEELAEGTRRDAIGAGVEDVYPFDVESTVEFLFDFDLNHGAALPPGVLGSTDFDQRIVSVSERIRHDGRRRFTVAHEIGHIVLHRVLLEAQAAQVPLFTQERLPAQDSRMELQADRFAAALLMPRDAMLERFGADVRQGDLIEPARVADAFGTSVEAARIRLEGLRMVLRDSPGRPIDF